MYKQTIIKYLLEYVKKKNIKFKKAGKVTMLQCPFCNKEPMSANIIPNTNIVNCFVCKQKYTVIDIAKKVDNIEGAEDDVLQHIKELLNIEVMTHKDEQHLEDYFDYYVANGFDLVPVVKDGKIPVEKSWTKKSHKDKKEWKEWIASGLNLGLKTGAISGVTILDIDQKPIPKELKDLLGDTLYQESTNGFHFIYKYDSELPKTRIDDFKLDIENDGGQVVCYPSKVKGVQRKIINLKPLIKMPEELKKFLLDKVTIRCKTKSEEIKEDIETENFKINLEDFKLKNNNLEGCCNTSFLKLGGILRKQLNNQQTGYVLYTLNKYLLENPMPSQELNAMINSLDSYTQFDEEELASKILEYVKDVEEANRNEIALTIVGSNRGEDKKRADKALNYLVREGYLLKRRNNYRVIKKANWKESLINIGVPIDFKIPYFNDIMNFNEGDLILIGSRNSAGKTHISLNIIKELVKQGKKPYYLSLESGSRWAKIALQLGLKEGDFKWDESHSFAEIELEKNAITIIDWVCPNNYAETDKLIMYFTKQLQKNGGVLIIFVQLRQDNTWFAKDLIKQFPAFACRYVYDDESSGEYGKFIMDKIRDPKLKIKTYELPAKYNWKTKELILIQDIKDEELQNKKEN